RKGRARRMSRYPGLVLPHDLQAVRSVLREPHAFQAHFWQLDGPAGRKGIGDHALLRLAPDLDVDLLAALRGHRSVDAKIVGSRQPARHIFSDAANYAPLSHTLDERAG